MAKDSLCVPKCGLCVPKVKVLCVPKCGLCVPKCQGVFQKMICMCAKIWLVCAKRWFVSKNSGGLCVSKRWFVPNDVQEARLFTCW